MGDGESAHRSSAQQLVLVDDKLHNSVKAGGKGGQGVRGKQDSRRAAYKCSREKWPNSWSS